MHGIRHDGSHEPVEEIEICLLNGRLAKEYYGKVPPYTIRGYCAIVDGEVAAIAGLCWQRGHPVFFTEAKEKYYHLRHKVAFLRPVLKVMKWVRESPVMVYASPQEGEGFYGHEKLTKLGFAPVTRTLYRWLG